MPKFSVSKSIDIQAPMDQVFASIRDFKQWNHWSPWLMAEPGCPVTYGNDGSSYGWEGKIVGSGQMQIVNEKAPNSIDYKLTFLKPFKSRADVAFHLASTTHGARLTWSMNSSLPFFLFFMTRMMSTLVGMDYERGLLKLKDYIETGSVPSRLDFIGPNPFPGFHYIAIRRQCPLANVGPSMEATFQELQQAMASKAINATGKAFSIYHKWNLSKGFTEYSSGFSVPSLPASLPQGVISGSIPACQVYSIRHTGPYHHLGNPWAAGMFRSRAKIFAQNKKIAPFETYDSGIKDAPPSETVTTIHFPMK